MKLLFHPIVLVLSCVVLTMTGATVFSQTHTGNRTENKSSRPPVQERDDLPEVELTEFIPSEAQESVRIAFRVISGASKSRIRVIVDAGVDSVTSREIGFEKDGIHEVTVKLFEGINRISLIGFAHDEPVNLLSRPIEIRCGGKWCRKLYSLTPETVALASGETSRDPVRVEPEPEAQVRNTDEPEERGNIRPSGNEQPNANRNPSTRRTTRSRRQQNNESANGATNQLVQKQTAGDQNPSNTPADPQPDAPPQDTPPANAGNQEPNGEEQDPAGQDAAEDAAAFTIDRPENDFETKDTGSIDSYLTVTGGEIKKIKYDVRNGDRTFVSKSIDIPSGDPAQLVVRVRILSGTNTIRFFNAEGEAELASLVVKCTENCGEDFLVAEFPSNSQNTRAIVGLGQAGGSSASSETKPFLDFFFTAPIINRSNSALPRLSAWGQVGLDTTPDQIAAAGVLPSTLVNQVGRSDSGSNVDLVQSFNFLAGLELRAYSTEKPFFSLIPGIDQKTHFYLVGGGGAISPLTARRDAIEMFRIPATNSPQRQEFVKRYGTPPNNKQFIALAPLDRDRFYRQWYLGFRLKTYYCENTSCTEHKNRFPAILDVMFGQNESVTGGSLKYAVTDPDDPTQIRGEKNAYVLRIDAFYPFPIRSANFLYFYGNAAMKLGGGGVRVQTPLFLDTAEGGISINDPRVYIPPLDQQKILLPNRDYYKLGIGIDLTALFNRNNR